MTSLSVILPVYNGEHYIKAAVDSILQQTYPHFELLIFNDASTDKTGEILHEYTDSRINVFTSASNKGYLFHLNHGLRIAKGKYIARMDADDVSHQDRFRNQIDYLNYHPEISLLGTAVTLLENDVLSDKDWYYPENPEAVGARLLFSTPHAHPTILFRRELFDAGDYYYDQNYYSTEDYELWTRLSAKYKLSNLKQPLLWYRISAGQTSSTRKMQQRKLESEIRNRNIEQYRKFITEEERKKFSNTWEHAFDVSANDIIVALSIYNEIYEKADRKIFKQEIAIRVKEIVLANYRKSEQLISWYRGSSIGLDHPLKIKYVVKNKIFHQLISYLHGKKANQA